MPHCALCSRVWIKVPVPSLDQSPSPETICKSKFIPKSKSGSIPKLEPVFLSISEFVFKPKSVFLCKLQSVFPSLSPFPSLSLLPSHTPCLARSHAPSLSWLDASSLSWPEFMPAAASESEPMPMTELPELMPVTKPPELTPLLNLCQSWWLPLRLCSCLCPSKSSHLTFCLDYVGNFCLVHKPWLLFSETCCSLPAWGWQFVCRLWGGSVRSSGWPMQAQTQGTFLLQLPAWCHAIQGVAIK